MQFPAVRHDPSWHAFHYLSRLRHSGDYADQRSKSTLPYMRVRGSVDLLCPQERTEDASSGKSTERCVSTRRERRRFDPPLGRRESKGEIPAVGTYTLSSSLLKKSFSNYKPKPLRMRVLKTGGKEAATVSYPRLRPYFQYSIRKKENRRLSSDRFDALRPEVAVEVAKKTNFQGIVLEDTPRDIEQALELKARRRLKEERLGEIKEISQQLAQRACN